MDKKVLLKLFKLLLLSLDRRAEDVPPSNETKASLELAGEQLPLNDGRQWIERVFDHKSKNVMNGCVKRTCVDDMLEGALDSVFIKCNAVKSMLERDVILPKQSHFSHTRTSL